MLERMGRRRCHKSNVLLEVEFNAQLKDLSYRGLKFHHLRNNETTMGRVTRIFKPCQL